MRSAVLFTAVLAATLSGACARAPVAVTDIARPYRITIQQGNYVTREMVEQLRPGMSKEEVRFLLGTPLLTDIFHADRWDYVFYRDAPGGRREQRNFAVIFENGRLARVIGDLLPTEPGAASVPRPEAGPPEPKAQAAASGGAAPRGVTPAPAQGNGRAASDPPPGPSDPGAGAERGAPAQEAADARETKTGEKPARGFFGRMLERIGL